MAGPRNNYSRLPWAVRCRVLSLLYDGAEYDEIRRDPEVAAACKERNLTLHNATFLAVRKCEEYKEFGRKSASYAAAQSADRIAAGVLNASGAQADLTDVARYEISRAVREILDDDDGEPGSRAKHLRTLSQTLLALNNSAKDEQIAALRRKLDEKGRSIADLKAKVSELENAIAAGAAETGAAQTGISPEKLAEVEGQIKML
jgi:hypothetical protein